jgi:hypothetical protein
MQIQVCQTKPAKKYERRDGLYRPAALLFSGQGLACAWVALCGFPPAIWRKRPFVSASLSMPLAEYPSCRLSRRQGMAKIERAFAQWYNRIG